MYLDECRNLQHSVRQDCDDRNTLEICLDELEYKSENHIENKKFNLDNDDLMKISLRLLKNYSKRDLNKEQLYILIKLSLLIGKAAKNKNDQHSQYKNFLRFLHEKLIIAHGLKLGDLFKDSEFSKEIINKLKKKYNKYLFKKIPSVIEA